LPHEQTGESAIIDKKEAESLKDIDFIGNYKSQNQGFSGSVYGTKGVSPCVRARDYKEPITIME
jgi:hypothetical protein